MQLGRAHAAAVGHADRDRELHRPARAPAVAPDVRDQLVEARVAERVVLHLADGPPAGHAEPDRGAEDPGLGERRVDAAVRRRSGRAARPSRGRRRRRGRRPRPGPCTFVVALQLDVEAVVDRLDERAAQLTEDPPQLGEVVVERRGRVGERVLEDERRVRRRLGLGGRDPVAHRARRLAADLLRQRVGRGPEPPQVAARSGPTHSFALLLLDPLEVDVRLRVVGGRVRRGAVGDRLDERRPVAGARARDRLARRLVDREHVAAVDPRARASRSRPPCRRASPPRVCAESGVEIAHWLLLQKRTSGARITAGEVRALVERALGGGAVAEVRDRTRRLAAQLLAPGEPGRVRDVGRDRDADRGDVVVGRVPPARRDGRATRRGPSRRASRAGARSPTRGSSGRSSRRRSSAYTEPACIASWFQKIAYVPIRPWRW